LGSVNLDVRKGLINVGLSKKIRIPGKGLRSQS
jgi:hypothetical protein